MKKPHHGMSEFGLTAKDILEGVEPADVKTPEQIESESAARFEKGLKDYCANPLEGKRAEGMNIQDV